LADPDRIHAAPGSRADTAESTRIDIAARVSGRLEKIAPAGKLLPLFALFFALLGAEALIQRAG